MPQSLDTFAARVREILQQDDSPAGREKVAALVRDVLKDRAFADTLFDANSPERKVVYEDPQLGFCILTHRYTGPKEGLPHDHGPSWAIYGQYDGETLMSDWLPVEPPTPARPGKARKLRDYTLSPGLAKVYNEGDIHAPSRAGPTRLIRIEGVNLEGVPRGRYEPVQE
jgi:hypothetical protein